VTDSFRQRLEVIDWRNYGTAYGPAVKVPAQLMQLASGEHKAAMAASHDLWCGLCHQHAYVSSAALPALPFLLETLDHADEPLTVEILDILLGFAVCTGPQLVKNAHMWAAQLREELRRETPRVQILSLHPNEEIADFSGRITEELAAKVIG
jgi:hypothetical protein